MPSNVFELWLCTKHCAPSYLHGRVLQCSIFLVLLHRVYMLFFSRHSCSWEMCLLWAVQCVNVCVLSCFSRGLLFSTPWTIVLQAPLFMGFSRQEYGVGSHSLLQGVFWPRDWTQVSCILARFFTTRAAWEALSVQYWTSTEKPLA